VSHGSLTVSIMESAQISQPGAFGGGTTAVVPQSSIEVSEQGNRMFLLEGSSLQAIVNAVNAVGAAPGDIVAILEALKRVGALRAELEVI
jgi:flagellar P-ring protein precursor FlgI